MMMRWTGSLLLFFFLSASWDGGGGFVVVQALKFPGKGALGETAGQADSCDTVSSVLNADAAFDAMECMPLLQDGTASPLELMGKTLMDVARYKPPVGMVTLLVLTKLLLTKRLFHLYPKTDAPKNAVEAVLHKHHKKQSKRHKNLRVSYMLDMDDVAYCHFGGVDRIRQKLTLAALTIYDSSDVPESQEMADEKASLCLTQNERQLLGHVRGALSASRPGSRRDSVHDLIQPLSNIEALLNSAEEENEDGESIASQMAAAQQQQQRPRKRTTSSSSSTENDDSRDQLHQTLQVGIQLVEMRATDALLRVCRDRLLRTTHRLARTCDHWRHHLETLQGLPRWALQLSNTEQDQLRLLYARAAYEAEIERLGLVTKLLLERPADVSERVLLQVLQATERVQKERHKAMTRDCSADTELDQSSSSASMAADETTATETGPQRPLKRGGNIPRVASPPPPPPRDSAFQLSQLAKIPQKLPSLMTSISKYSLQWGTDALPSVRKIESSGRIDPYEAQDTLLRQQRQQQHGQEQWIQATADWTSRGRKLICQVLFETLQGASVDGSFDEDEFLELEQRWCSSHSQPRQQQGRHENDDDDTVDQEVIEKDWARILELVDSLPAIRRVGEGHAVRLKDASILNWTKRANVLGLPLALLQIAAASYIHQLIAPHWPELRERATQAFWKSLDILNQRAWIPIKGMYDEIMGQSYSLMEGFVLENEEILLDHILRDTGFSDGTKATRAKALEDATMQYEKGMANGMMLHFASGKLIQLLLIQMQQVKVGMLQALNYIDILMKGNQIHFQILAAIPAAMLLWFGTRLLIRALYNIRSKDLRPVTAAYAEMSTYLNQLESLALTSNTIDPATAVGSARTSSNDNVTTNDDSDKQAPKEDLQSTRVLGESLLYIHRYLILLDFSSALVPARAREDIHGSLQRLVSLWRGKQQQEQQRQSRKDGKGSALLVDQERLAPSKADDVQWINLVKERHDRLDQHFRGVI